MKKKKKFTTLNNFCFDKVNKGSSNNFVFKVPWP